MKLTTEYIKNIYPKVLRYARKFSKEHAEDIVQQAFLQLLQSDLRHYDNLNGLIYISVKNHFINHYRKDYNRKQGLYNLSKEPLKYQEINLENEEYLKQILSQTTEQDTELLLYAEGYSYEEISFMRGIKIQTVKTRIFYSRKRLQCIRVKK